MSTRSTLAAGHSLGAACVSLHLQRRAADAAAPHALQASRVCAHGARRRRWRAAPPHVGRIRRWRSVDHFHRCDPRRCRRSHRTVRSAHEACCVLRVACFRLSGSVLHVCRLLRVARCRRHALRCTCAVVCCTSRTCLPHGRRTRCTHTPCVLAGGRARALILRVPSGTAVSTGCRPHRPRAATPNVQHTTCSRQRAADNVQPTTARPGRA